LKDKLADMWKASKSFLRDNHDIMITRINKGNVAMRKKDYRQKMLILLSEKNTYKIENTLKILLIFFLKN